MPGGRDSKQPQASLQMREASPPRCLTAEATPEKKTNKFGMTPWEGFVPSDDEHAMQDYLLAKERFANV